MQLQQLALLVTGQACIQRVNRSQPGALLQGRMKIQCKVLGHCLLAGVFNAKKVDQPVHIQIGTGSGADSALLLFRQWHGSLEVRAGQCPLAGSNHQFVQRHTEHVTAVADGWQHRQIESLDEDGLLLPDGQPRYLKWLDGYEMDSRVGIGCYFECGGQITIRDFMVRQQYVKPGQRHPRQFKLQQGIVLLQKGVDIVQRDIQLRGQCRSQGLMICLIAHAGIQRFHP